MKKLNYLLLILVTAFLFPNFVNASENYVINNKASVPKSCTIKTQPNEGGTYLVPNKIHYLDPGDIVEVIDKNNAIKSTNSKCSTNYYKVKYAGNTGYVCGEFINFTNEGKYYNELRNAGFPESYLQSLNSLKELHPNWEFVAYKTGLDFNTVISKQSIVGKSYIQVSDPNGKDSVLLSLDGLSYNPDTKTFNQMESGGWYAANKATIAYYMDVRNFLNSRDIYMFEKNIYNTNNQTSKAVETIAGSTKLKDYVEEFVKSANLSGNNISPTLLVTRSRQEVVVAGGGLSSAANGSKGYYNFYNIGAFSKCVNPVLCGNNFAAGKGWTTASSAIAGGASFINDNYVKKGQDTIYFEKFNVTNNNTYSNQYMTNISAPRSEADYLYKGYTGANTIDAKTDFIIPVYENMPSTVSALPTTINKDELDKANQSTNSETNKLDISTIVNGAGFRYNSDYISNIAIGSTASSVISRLKAISGSAEIIITSDSKQISGNEVLGTGDLIKITNNENTEKFRVIVYGDTNGDGNISVVDLLKVQKHILNTASLQGSYMVSADVNKDGTVNVVDLLAIQKQILGTSNISQ